MEAEQADRLSLTYDPMTDVHWTFWQALAWAAYRDVVRVREASDDWRSRGGRCEPDPIWDEVWLKPEVYEKSSEIGRDLLEGRLTASGKPASGGSRREISPLE